jgi:hypothetical protein
MTMISFDMEPNHFQLWNGTARAARHSYRLL